MLKTQGTGEDHEAGEDRQQPRAHQG
jgi:hypothetical protein